MTLRIRRLGRVDYQRCWAAMREFSAARGADTADELWVVEHDRVFTQGRGGKPEHLLAPGDIPVIATDRGGQVTYHGPGQVVVYLLLDLNRLHIGPRELVRRLEQGVIECLAALGVEAERRAGAPGVYVGAAKVASLGLRIRNGMSYHGVALNVDLELEPFARINPCGYAGLAVTRLADLGVAADTGRVGDRLVAALARTLYGGVAPALEQGEPQLPTDDG